MDSYNRCQSKTEFQNVCIVWWGASRDERHHLSCRGLDSIPCGRNAIIVTVTFATHRCPAKEDRPVGDLRLYRGRKGSTRKSPLGSRIEITWLPVSLQTPRTTVVRMETILKCPLSILMSLDSPQWWRFSKKREESNRRSNSLYRKIHITDLTIQNSKIDTKNCV